jgi:hypothetical protein
VDDLVGLDAAAVAGTPLALAYVGWTVAVPRGLPIDALELPSDVLVQPQQPGPPPPPSPHPTVSSRSTKDGVSGDRSTAAASVAYRLERINSPLDLKVFHRKHFASSANASAATACVVACEAACASAAQQAASDLAAGVDAPAAATTVKRPVSPVLRRCAAASCAAPCAPAAGPWVVGRLSRLVVEKNPHAFVLVAAVVQRHFKERALADPACADGGDDDDDDDSADDGADHVDHEHCDMVHGERPEDGRGGVDDPNLRRRWLRRRQRQRRCLPPRFVLAGDGPALLELTSLAAEVGANVEFVGGVAADHVPRFLASLHVFL